MAHQFAQFLNFGHTAVTAHCGDQFVGSPGVRGDEVIRPQREHTAMGGLVWSAQPCQHQSEV
ncbi:MAG: hypothetical protein DLM60_16345 [Pseudonocardiales bacterium]|nr:MAG: hypothetical protein DLM60_16345 [Pseudonocardiales bacterium]